MPGQTTIPVGVDEKAVGYIVNASLSAEDTQSLNVQVFEATPNYVCALPGKMTEAPYLGRAAMLHITGNYAGTGHTASYNARNPTPLVTPRPMDLLL